jgi:hypothetical protein
LVGNVKERDGVGHLVVEERMILEFKGLLHFKFLCTINMAKLILGKWVVPKLIN